MMTQAILDKDNIASTAGDITVFNYDGVTREYLFSTVEYLALCVGIPAASCTDAPGIPQDGFAICRTEDFTAWEYQLDHRGETIYSIETGEAITVSALGDYPEGTTPQAPSSPYDTWNGSEWVMDTAAQHADEVTAADQHKTELLIQAKATIGFWQTELQLGLISDEDKGSLVEWINYIKALRAVDLSTAPNIIWPEQPV